MPRVTARLLIGMLCLTTSAAWAQKSRSTGPTPRPMAPEELQRAPVPQQLSVEGFAGGLFLLSHPSAEIPGVGTVEASAPPVFRWGARLSSPFYRLTPSAKLEWVATLGISHTGFSQEFLGMTMSSSTLALDVLPGLRARLEVLPKLSLTGELGIGVQLSRTSTQMTFAGEKAQGAAAGVFRVAVGGQYEVTDELGLYFEPLALHQYVGQGSALGWSLQAGIAYAL